MEYLVNQTNGFDIDDSYTGWIQIVRINVEIDVDHADVDIA